MKERFEKETIAVIEKILSVSASDLKEMGNGLQRIADFIKLCAVVREQQELNTNRRLG